MANKSYIKISNNAASEIKKGWVKTNNGVKSLAAGWVKTGSNEVKQIYPPEDWYTVTIDCSNLDSVTFSNTYKVSTSGQTATYYVPASATWGQIKPTGSKTNYTISWMKQYEITMDLSSNETFGSIANGDTSFTILPIVEPVKTYVYVHKNGGTISSNTMPSANLVETTNDYYKYYVDFNKKINTVLPSSNPTKTNYNFKGWGTSEYATEANKITTTDTVGTSTLHLYPIFEIIKVTLTIYAHGGTLSNWPSAANNQYNCTSYSSGENLYYTLTNVPCTETYDNLLPATKTKSGYNFSQWSYTNNGSAITSFPASIGTSNVTLHCVWYEQTVDIRIYKDGGSFSNINTSYGRYESSEYLDYYGVPLSTTISSILPTSTKTDYYLSYWYDGNDDTISTSNSVATLSSSSGVSYREIHPAWIVNTVRVRIYKVSGVTYSNVNTNYSYSNYSSYYQYYLPYNIQLSTIIPTVTGTGAQTLRRWTTSSTDNYSAVNLNQYGRDLSSINLYPQLKVKVEINKSGSTFSYNDSNVNSIDIENFSSYKRYWLSTGTALSTVLPTGTPTYSGKRFIRWYDGQQSASMLSGQVQKATVTSSTTVGTAYMDIYPEMLSTFRVKISRTILQEEWNWDTSASGTYYGSTSYLAQYDVTVVDTWNTIRPTWGSHSGPYRYGYNFSKWTDSNGNTITDNSHFSAATTVSAQWTANYWTITMQYTTHTGIYSMTPSYLYVEKDQSLSTARTTLNDDSYSTGLPTVTLTHDTQFWPISHSWYCPQSMNRNTTGSAVPSSNWSLISSIVTASNYSGRAYNSGGKTYVSWGTAVTDQKYYIAFKKANGIWFMAKGTLSSSKTTMNFANSNYQELIVIVCDRQPTMTDTANYLAYSKSSYANGVVHTNGTGTRFGDLKGANTLHYSGSSTPIGYFFFFDNGVGVAFDENHAYSNSNGTYQNGGHFTIQFSGDVNDLKCLT